MRIQPVNRINALRQFIVLILFACLSFSGQMIKAENLPIEITLAGQQKLSDSINIPSHKPFLRRALPYVALTAAGGLFFPLDRHINREFYKRRNRGHAADQAFNVIRQFGMAGPYLIAVPLLAGHGLIFKNEKSKYVAGELVVGGLIAGGVTEVFKKSFGRERPYQTSDPFRFFKGGSSFYSGHTIMAFTFATVLSRNYPSQDLGFMGIHKHVPILPILTYTAGGLVGIQRLYSHDHWASDVYYGVLAGYGAGSLAVYLGDKKRFSHLKLGLGKPGTVELSYSFN